MLDCCTNRRTIPVVLEEVECSIFFRPALLPSVTFIRKALDDPEAALMTRAKSVAPFLTIEAVARNLQR